MLNPYIRKLSIISGILGSVQSVAWSIACIIQFCYYTGTIRGPSYGKNKTYKSVLSNTMYDFFIRRDEEMLHFNHSYNIYINGNVILSMAIAYFIFSLVWLCTSIGLVKIAIQHNMQRNGWILICWSFITLLISLLDIAVTGILASDYLSVIKIAFECLDCVVYPTAIIIVLCIACRGIVLWIINFFLAVLLLYLLNISVMDFGDDTENEELSWFKRMGFFRFKIPRPRLATFMHKIRNPNEWWIFENSDSSETSTSTEARRC